MNWLRIMVWQLSITNGHLSSSSNDSSMTFKYPIEVAKDLVRDIQNISLDAMEVHGVGLIEKLFDIACTLTDVIACVPFEVSTSEPPFDILSKLLHLVSKLRGGSSRYLPLLLTKVSETLPNVARSDPVELDPTQMIITQGYAGATDKLPTPAPAQYSSLGSFGPEGFNFGSQYFLSQQQEYGAQHDRRPDELMFDTYSPTMISTEPTSAPSSSNLGTPPAGFFEFVGQMNAPRTLRPAPHSVPVGANSHTKYEEYPG
jgi:hypothetical protein